MSIFDLFADPTRGHTGRGGGMATIMPKINTWRGTSRQVCGLFPFAAGANAPLVGVPLGKSLDGIGAVCADPISWFERGLISAPSMFVLGLPGLGKSSLVRHMMMGWAGFGIHSMVLGDIKPDYVDLIEALGGQVIGIGHGRGQINPLDAGNAREVADLLPPKQRDALLADAHARTLTMVSSLVNIIRGSAPSDREVTILDKALRVLEELTTADFQPVLADLLQVIQEAPDEVRQAALDRGSMDRYREVTEDLEASLTALLSGRFGEIFAGKTTVAMKLDRSVVFDVSALLNAEESLQAAVLLACWSYGFASVEVSQALADAGVTPRQKYAIIMDELWRILRSGSGMVDNVDALTRLNRQIGVGQVMITHTMSDLDALATEADRMKARGFVERSKMLICGGLPLREMAKVTEVVAMSEKEQMLLSSWQDPAVHDPVSGAFTAPPGRGKFLLKVGNRPGISFQVQLTPRELSLNDTNKRWDT